MDRHCADDKSNLSVKGNRVIQQYTGKKNKENDLIEEWGIQ